MTKSKNRKDHSKKVAARNQRINQATNMKKKQLTAWLQQMQAQAQAQTQATENVDVNQAIQVEDVSVEEISSEIVGESGQL
jgi:hypothetical protein